jgi:hypothetical protein
LPKPLIGEARGAVFLGPLTLINVSYYAGLAAGAAIYRRIR